MEDIVTELVKQNVIINQKTKNGRDSFSSVEIPKTQIIGTNRHKGGKVDQGEETLLLVSKDPLQISEETLTSTQSANKINSKESNILNESVFPTLELPKGTKTLNQSLIPTHQ